MNIVFTLNNNFVPQVATCIQSILENKNENDDLNFYLIADDITESNKSLLKQQAQSFSQNIIFVDLGDLKKLVGFSFHTGAWSPIVLARLFLDKLLPASVTKVIYLDGDTIVRGSLKALWNTNLESNIIGMSPEPTVSVSRKEFLNLGENPYCNAGVLLINIELWKKMNIGTKILSYYKENNGQLFANDQDALNAVLVNNRVVISPKFNYFNIFDQYPYRALKKMSQPASFITAEEFGAVRKNPVIIHFLGEERPWRIGNQHRFSDEFSLYLSHTAWNDLELETGWNTYFKAYYAFNMVTRPFPGMRVKIMNFLIPKLMKVRSKK